MLLACLLEASDTWARPANKLGMIWFRWWTRQNVRWSFQLETSSLRNVMNGCLIKAYLEELKLNESLYISAWQINRYKAGRVRERERERERVRKLRPWEGNPKELFCAVDIPALIHFLLSLSLSSCPSEFPFHLFLSHILFLSWLACSLSIWSNLSVFVRSPSYNL